MTIKPDRAAQLDSGSHTDGNCAESESRPVRVLNRGRAQRRRYHVELRWEAGGVHRRLEWIADSYAQARDFADGYDARVPSDWLEWRAWLPADRKPRGILLRGVASQQDTDDGEIWVYIQPARAEHLRRLTCPR